MQVSFIGHIRLFKVVISLCENTVSVCSKAKSLAVLSNPSLYFPRSEMNTDKTMTQPGGAMEK